MLRNLAIATSVLVGLFLLATLIAGFLGVGASNPADISLDPNQLPERFDANRSTPAGRLPQLGAGAGGWVRHEDSETGRVMHEFRYGTMEPREAGEFDVTEPEARLYLAPHRVVHLYADEGVITAPDNIPQQGRFFGGCTIRLYETDPGDTVDLGDDSDDLVATIRMEDATFDARLGKIDSTGSVVVRSATALFKGRGLTLVYNEPRQRVDYLEITEGEYLRYRTPERDNAPPAEPPADRDAVAQGDAEVESTDEQLQFYKVVFERAVHVRSEGRSIDADKLTGFFVFDRDGSIDPRTVRADEPDLPAGALASATDDAVIMASAAAVAEDAVDTDVIMTWEGKMIVTPELVRPERLVGDRDVLLTFNGSPVELHSENNDRITCDRAEYHESADQVALRGSPQWPLRIDSPALGSLHADDMTLELGTGRGAIWGAGALQAHPAGRGAEGGLPENFAIRWSDRVDLQITSPDEPAQGLKLARFVGDVAVDDPRFALRGRELGVMFEADLDGKGRHFAGIDGRGDIVINSADGSIQGDVLTLRTEEDPSGRIVPTTLHAEQKVLVQNAVNNESIACDRLDVTFVNRPDIDRDTGKPRVDVGMLLAGGDVVLRTADGAEVRARQLEADNTTGAATLAGTPVTIQQDDSTLTVARMDITDRGGKAIARGDGRFVLDRPDPDDPDGAPSKLDVRWHKAMTYNRAANTIEVAGDVTAEQSDRADQLNRLSAESLLIEMIRDAGEADDGEAVEALQDVAAGQTVLKRLVADGKAVLLAQRWTDASQENLIHRLRLSAPRITYDHVTERVEAPGKGTLLLEDYSDDATAAKAIEAVPVTGRGATLFTWTGSLTMDAAAADVIFTRDVHMTHRPAESDQVMQMQAHRLVADMQTLGGLTAFQMSKAESLEIDHIEATGQVQLRDGRRMISAHRIHYDGPTQRAVLTALPDRHVQVIQLDQAKPIRARRITWDLGADRVEIDAPEY